MIDIFENNDKNKKTWTKQYNRSFQHDGYDDITIIHNAYLPYKVKTRHVQILNIINTFNLKSRHYFESPLIKVR